MRVVSSCRMNLPITRTEVHLRPWYQGLVEFEARTKLPGRHISQRHRVPLRHLVGMTRRDQCLEHWITRLQGCVTTAMVAVQMRVDQKVERPLAQNAFN